LAQGLAPEGQKVKKFGNAHFANRLRDQAEVLQDDREPLAAGLRQAWHHQI